MRTKICYKLLGLFCLLAVIGLTLITIIYNFKSDNSTKNSSSQLTSYSTEYYTINSPSNISAKSRDNYETLLYMNDTIVGTITVNPNCEYCSTTSSIISNWMGMHAYAKDDHIIEEDFDTYKMAKVLIAFELSAAQEVSGETAEPDQLHYFYTNPNNLFIDLFIDNTIISEEDADLIADSFILK